MRTKECVCVSVRETENLVYSSIYGKSCTQTTSFINYGVIPDHLERLESFTLSYYTEQSLFAR